jgi:hypothetical protein
MEYTIAGSVNARGKLTSRQEGRICWLKTMLTNENTTSLFIHV